MPAYQFRFTLLLIIYQIVFSNCSFAADLDVVFDPSSPSIHLNTTTEVGDTTVYDHSEFSIEITNNHYRSITIQRVNFISIGDVQRSRLGDIINYWPWDGSRTLEAGESISFDKVWGFTVDTPNKKMKYRFEFTYNVEDSSEKKLLAKELTLRPDW